MKDKTGEPNGFFQILALAAFTLPMIYMDRDDPLAWVFVILGFAALFSMMLESYK